MNQEVTTWIEGIIDEALKHDSPWHVSMHISYAITEFLIDNLRSSRVKVFYRIKGETDIDWHASFRMTNLLQKCREYIKPALEPAPEWDIGDVEFRTLFKQVESIVTKYAGLLDETYVK